MGGAFKRGRTLAGLALLALLAGGCAANPEAPTVEVPAEHQFSEFEHEGVV